MWSTVLLLALLTALDPARLGLTLLVISRPRPVQNLLAYWAGCLIEGFPATLVPLVVLHGTPMFKSFAEHLGTSPTVRHIQIGMGVLALSVGALIMVRSLARRRQRVPLLGQGGNTSTPMSDSTTPPLISWLLGRAQEGPTEGQSALRRLLGRTRTAWENGSLWVAFMLGYIFGGPAIDGIIYVLAIIVASGATIGTQVEAAIMFVVVMLAVCEITLASYWITPAKTQAVVQRVHDWALAHCRKIVVAVCTAGGISLLANGIGGA